METLILRLLTPFRIHFSIDKSRIFANPNDYVKRWDALARHIEGYAGKSRNISTITCSHSGVDIGFMKYHDIYENANRPTPEVITMHLEDGPETVVHESMAGVLDEIDATESNPFAFEIVPGTSVLRLFDNTVSTYEVSIQVSKKELLDRVDAFIAFATQWGNRYTDIVVGQLYGRVIFPLLVGIWESPVNTDFIEKPGEHKGFPEMVLGYDENKFDRILQTPERLLKRKNNLDPRLYRDKRAVIAAQTLWVNRSLYTSGLTTKERHEVIHKWAPLAPEQGEARRVLEERNSVFLGWGHNVFDQDQDERLASDGWDALLFMQYYYSSFDSLNTSLSRYVGLSLAELTAKQVRNLSYALQDVNTYASILGVAYEDDLMNLQGARRGMATALAERYEVTILLSSIARKQEALTKIVDRLFEKSTRIYQRVVEVILFGIGGVALIDLTVSLSSYANSNIERPLTSPAEDAFSGVLDIASRLPPDLFINTSVVTLIIITALYMILIKRKS